MKVVIDSHIPYLEGLLEPYATVLYADPKEITSELVRDADALFVRTRTRCDAALLAGSKVRFVGTATIGYDHIDVDYCKVNGVFWTNAPGCNAQGVCDYVETALDELGLFTDGRPHTIGIVGVGHVGRLVEQMAERHEWSVLRCDPLRAENEPTEWFENLDEIGRKADVVTFHTPMDRTGRYPTYHMADERFFALCAKDTLVINAARGGVVDEDALLHSGLKCVIDCWEGEPELNRRLLEHAELATFHIAGYTKLGKYRASEMILSSFCDFFDLPSLKIEKKAVSLQSQSRFDIRSLSDSLKSHPDRFEDLREKYPLR